MMKTWKFNGIALPVELVDKYYREKVMRVPIEAISLRTGVPVMDLARHESGEYGNMMHNAYFDVEGNYEAWLNFMDEDTRRDVIDYVMREKEQYSYGTGYVHEDILLMSDSEFNSFADQVIQFLA